MRLWGYPIRVAGISHYVAASHLQVGEIECEREPNNPYDPNAVAIYAMVLGSRQKIGYLSRHIARHLAGASFPHKGQLVWVGKNGVMVEI